MEDLFPTPDGQSGHRELTPEDVSQLRDRVRSSDTVESFLSREEELWPDGKGKTIRWPDSNLEVRISFEDPDTAEEESYGR